MIEQRYRQVLALLRTNMLHRGLALGSAGVLLMVAAHPLFAPEREAPSFTRQEDVIYARKHGTALTMDVFTPKKNANGAAAILVVSGGWSSARKFPAKFVFVDELLTRGYTVFAVVHGSQPQYTVPEIIQDVNRAVRFIRHHARDYKIDPNRLGIYGASSGGHLALMQALAGDTGDPSAEDPVEKVSSRVRAVACFFPPTDFLNYGKPGEVALGRGALADLKAAFDFRTFDTKTKAFVLVKDEEQILKIGREISPAYHVSKDAPPTLIFHGDADKLVPIQQSRLLVQKLKEKDVEVKLVVKPGAGHAYGLVMGHGHGWPNLSKDLALIADWFDKHLRE
jgi:acetyl esterase/lipase